MLNASQRNKAIAGEYNFKLIAYHAGQHRVGRLAAQEITSHSPPCFIQPMLVRE